LRNCGSRVCGLAVGEPGREGVDGRGRPNEDTTMRLPALIECRFTGSSGLSRSMVRPSQPTRRKWLLVAIDEVSCRKRPRRLRDRKRAVFEFGSRVPYHQVRTASVAVMSRTGTRGHDFK